MSKASSTLVRMLMNWGKNRCLSKVCATCPPGFSHLDQFLACARAQNIIDRIHSHLSDNRRGEILRSGIKLVIFGPPNAGKSSLFNFLGSSIMHRLFITHNWFNTFPPAERDAAIISPIPGTTRDILSLTLDIGGLPVVLNDTAGIRSTTDDAIERIGVERAGHV